MKNGWFAVRIENNDPYNLVYYQKNLITRVWIRENEISFMVNDICDHFGTNEQDALGNTNYKLTVVEFNKLKAHLEKLIGID